MRHRPLLTMRHSPCEFAIDLQVQTIIRQKPFRPRNPALHTPGNHNHHPHIVRLELQPQGLRICVKSRLGSIVYRAKDVRYDRSQRTNINYQSLRSNQERRERFRNRDDGEEVRFEGPARFINIDVCSRHRVVPSSVRLSASSRRRQEERCSRVVDQYIQLPTRQRLNFLPRIFDILGDCDVQAQCAHAHPLEGLEHIFVPRGCDDMESCHTSPSAIDPLNYLAGCFNRIRGTFRVELLR